MALTDPATVTNWISFVDEIVGALERKQGKRTDVPGLHVVDDMTVQATTINPSAIFLDLFGASFMVLPKHILDGIPMDQLLKSPFAHEPTVSTGPFHVASYNADQFVQIDRNPNYWGTPALLDKVFIRLTDSDAGMAGLQRGEIDIISGGVPPSDVDDLGRSGDITVTSFPFDTCLTLYPNLRTAFGDVRVRQAMFYGIDRESIVKNVLQGYGKVAYSVFAETSPYYSSNVNRYPFEPDKARQLLKDAQWDSKQDLRFYVGSGDKVTEQTATVIQQQLQAIGITSHIQLEEFSTFVTRLIKNHDFDIALAGNVGLNNLDLTRRFACRMYTDGVNAGGYCNATLDTTMDQARATVKLDEQKPLTEKIQQTIVDEAGTVPIFYRDDIGAVNTKKIGGAVPHFGGIHRDIAQWYVNS